MNLILTLIRLMIAVALLTFGVDHINQPSNFDVALGCLDAFLALAILYPLFKSFVKKI